MTQQYEQIDVVGKVVKRWFDTHKATLLAVVLIIVGVTFTFWYRDDRIDSCRDRGGVPSVSDWWVDPMDIRCNLK